MSEVVLALAINGLGLGPDHRPDRARPFDHLRPARHHQRRPRRLLHAGHGAGPACSASRPARSGSRSLLVPLLGLLLGARDRAARDPPDHPAGVAHHRHHVRPLDDPAGERARDLRRRSRAAWRRRSRARCRCSASTTTSTACSPRASRRCASSRSSCSSTAPSSAPGSAPCATIAETATALGIPVTRVCAFTFALGTAMALLGGAIAAPITTVEFRTGVDILPFCFMAVVIGGLGNLQGTVAAAMLLAVMEGLVTSVADPTIARIVSLARDERRAAASARTACSRGRRDDRAAAHQPDRCVPPCSSALAACRSSCRCSARRSGSTSSPRS